MLDLEKIYTATEFKIASKIATDAASFFKKEPCGIKFKQDHVQHGMMLMFFDKYKSRFFGKIKDNPEINTVIESINNYDLNTCNNGFVILQNFESLYFRYLFRMCHARYLAISGKKKDFLIYLDDNERVRRILRPKCGPRITPLFKINTEVFKECKKLLV